MQESPEITYEEKYKMKLLRLALAFLFIILFVNTTEAQDDSLLLYFPFDENSGDKAQDISGNGG